MITDSMTKYEVMKTLRKEFDEEILPYYYKFVVPKIRPLIEQRSKREKKTITLGWEKKLSTQLTEFQFLKRGNAEGDLPIFISIFRWRDKLCFGNFFPEGKVVIYQAHCIARYAERVLQQNEEISKVFFNHIVKKQDSAFNITLPTPTHPFTVYHGMAQALFLGDFDAEHPKESFKWYNTCISYNETHYSQLRITQSLHEMQTYVEKVKCDFSERSNEQRLNAFLKKNMSNPDAITLLTRFLIQKYLLWKLHLHFNFDFTQLYKDEVEATLEYIEKQLKLLDVNPNSLSPFSKTHGIAWKGEIDYVG